MGDFIVTEDMLIAARFAALKLSEDEAMLVQEMNNHGVLLDQQIPVDSAKDTLLQKRIVTKLCFPDGKEFYALSSIHGRLVYAIRMGVIE